MFTTIRQVLTSFGGAGAVANAGRACRQRRDTEAALEVELRRFRPAAVKRAA